MINIIKFKGEKYPKFQEEGNASQFAIPFAKHVCNGEGYDIGCMKKEWAFPGSTPIDLSFEDEYDALNLPKQSFAGANERAAKILACLPAEIENGWVIDSVATMPEYRGKGIAELLMYAVLEEGRKQGFSLTQVNMYIGNEPALRLYKKLGFEVIEETRDKHFETEIGSPGMLSLRKKL